MVCARYERGMSGPFSHLWGNIAYGFGDCCLDFVLGAPPAPPKEPKRPPLRPLRGASEGSVVLGGPQGGLGGPRVFSVVFVPNYVFFIEINIARDQ